MGVGEADVGVGVALVAVGVGVGAGTSSTAIQVWYTGSPVMRVKVNVSVFIDAVGTNHAAAPLVSPPLPVRVCVAGFHVGTSVCVPVGHPLGFGDTLQ